MRQTYKHIAILSAYSDKSSEKLNEIATVVMRSRLQNATELKGCYKFKRERSFMVPIDSTNSLEDLLKIAWAFGQESILVQDNEGISSLHYVSTNKVERLGKLVPITEDEAKSSGNYSYVNNNYWGIK